VDLIQRLWICGRLGAYLTRTYAHDGLCRNACPYCTNACLFACAYASSGQEVPGPYNASVCYAVAG
jgi:hypothetical protein